MAEFRKTEPQTLSEAINQWIKSCHLEDQFFRASLLDWWKETMGISVARHTKSLRIENKILKIVVDNAPLRHQLAHSKTRIIQMVNQKAGRQVVEECLVL